MGHTFEFFSNLFFGILFYRFEIFCVASLARSYTRCFTSKSPLAVKRT